MTQPTKILVVSQPPCPTVQTASYDEVAMRILRKIRHLCCENVDETTNVILTSNLLTLLGAIDQIRKRARHEGRPVSIIIKQFATLLFASGAIIQTDCPAALHVFDNARFETLLSTAAQKKDLLMNYDLQARLEELLRIKDGEIPDYLLATMEEPLLDDDLDIPAPPDKPNIPIHETVLTTIIETLGPLVERFPVLEKICGELAALTDAAAHHKPREAETCALAMGEHLNQLTRAVEDATIELLTPDQQPEKIVEKIVEREIPVPVFDADAHEALAAAFATQQAILTAAMEKLAAASKPTTPTIDFSIELAALEKEKSQLMPVFEALRQAEESAQEIESDLAEQQTDLQQQLKYGSPSEKAVAKSMLTEAETRLEAVRAHLVTLQALRQPIEDAINRFNRRANILHACQRKLELLPISIPEIPALTVSAVIPLPENIEPLPPELSPKLPEPPPNASPSFAKEGTAGEVVPLPTPPTSDFYHLLAITAFFVCGPSKLPLITKALSSLNILSDAAEQAAFKTACHQSRLIHAVSPDTFQLDGGITYSPWMDEVIPEAKQKELCQLVHLPPPELAPLELLTIAALASFRQLSSRWISHLLARLGLAVGKDVNEIYGVCSRLRQASEYIAQCGAFGGTAIYKIKGGVTIPWQHAILSPREIHLLREEYAKVRLEKKRQHGEAR